MELDDTEYRYSLLIAGILVATIFSIFLVIALGVWGHSIFSGTGIEPVPGGLPLGNGENTMENNNPMDDILSGVEFLPLAEGCLIEDLDTEPGWVYIHDYYVPDPLPLCLTGSFGGATVISYGGYDFFGGTGLIFQGKSDAPLSEKLVGMFDIVVTGAWTDIAPEHCPWATGCTVDYWTVEFIVDGVVQLDSNHVPNILGDAPCDIFDFCDGVPENLDKWVDLGFITCWSGCEKPDQDFQIIYAYK
ncbi:MAG: hypothetical protein ACFE78_08140 [Candidatus Hodarchaeota archaeon]